MPEGGAAVEVKPVAVRPAVGERGRHPRQHAAVGRFAVAADESGYPAHLGRCWLRDGSAPYRAIPGPQSETGRTPERAAAVPAYPSPVFGERPPAERAMICPGEGGGRLSVAGAEFWLSAESPVHGNFGAETLGGGSVRMILTVPDPDAVLVQALKAGASEVFPVGEQHGWRLGDVVDPFGLHWEIGRPLVAQ